MIESILLCAILFLLLLLEGLFSGTEIAMVNADRLRLRRLAGAGKRGAALVLRMLRHPQSLLGTTLVGTNISLVAFTTLGTLLLEGVFEGRGDLAALLILGPITLILGEVVPKSVFQQHADTLAPRIIYPLLGFRLLFYPIVAVFSLVARILMKLVGVKARPDSLSTTREQVRLLLETAQEAANIDVFDRERLIRTVRFASTTVSEVMVPIGEAIMIGHRATTADAIELGRAHGYFRLPVFQDEPGRILGIVNLDVWSILDPQLSARTLDELCRPAFFVVADQLVDEILGVLQGRQDRMAIVVDEFGSAVGLITLEDILEQVIGEAAQLDHRLADHPVERRLRIERLENGTYRFDGRVAISEVCETLGIRAETRGATTIGGLFITQLRRLPRESDTLTLSGFRLTVETMTDRSVKTVLAEPL